MNVKPIRFGLDLIGGTKRWLKGTAEVAHPLLDASMCWALNSVVLHL